MDTKSVRLGLITTLHRRPAVTQAVLDYYRQLELPGVELCLVAAFTSPELDLPPRLWGRTMRCANRPFSDKWNAAARALQLYEAEGLVGAVVIGSDDLLSEAYIYGALQRLATGHHYAEPRQLYNLDLATGRMAQLRADFFGAGTTFRDSSLS